MKCPECGYKYAGYDRLIDIDTGLYDDGNVKINCPVCYKRQRAEEEYIYDLLGKRVR